MKSFLPVLLRTSLATSPLLLGTQCHQPQDPMPVYQLPPATQTGANTFGCLVNGKAFIPNGSDGNRGAPFTVVYEPSYQGALVIRAFRYTKKSDQSTRQDLVIGVDGVQGPGRYPLNRRYQEGTFSANGAPCDFYAGDAHYRTGELVITYLNKPAGIIAGTFHFTLYQPGCDSLIVTEGRFDKHL
ncbi:hypothetical protein [Hymenobacter sp. BT491]|uniref:hypothetical protein n=1 Tax=Hymenobacter sp. BT491 TaxID=2766779 RepID=UPI0016538A90|nr:hypothetical protein [Hymenobacter sp. BT491]MBC6992035.1 hypothetical protein [Hymenobacter sp. BT491]